MSEWNRDTPWRQGHLLDHDAIEALGLTLPDLPVEQHAVVVASHDCDLAQSPHAEPLVEIIVGRMIERSDGNYTYAKTARKLHVQFSGNANFWGDLVATAKFSVPKSELCRFSPRTDAVLDAENRSIFQLWLASRYRRSAFPDEFEQRLKDSKLDAKISRVLKPHGESITGIFFDVDGGDEVKRDGPLDTYRLEIYVLYGDAPDPGAAAQIAETIATEIATAFEAKLISTKDGMWQQIELASCEAISEAALSYQSFRQLKRWRLDHLSLGAEPQQSTVTE